MNALPPPSNHMALADYLDAFRPEDAAAPFLRMYDVADDKSLREHELTRGEFWSLAAKAAAVLRGAGLAPGDCHTHYFSSNAVGDLAFRLGAVMAGTTPVTVNWQADTPELLLHKLRATRSALLLVDAHTPAAAVRAAEEALPQLAVFDVARLHEAGREELPREQFGEAGVEATRIVIFTSGTTGRPKGVRLSYRAYRCNRATFESFLDAGEGKELLAVVTNPLHHTNSTAIADWAMRKPRARLHMLQRYCTQYWLALALAATPLPAHPPPSDAALAAALAAAHAAPRPVVVAPLVSRHFDFLDALAASSSLPLAPSTLRLALQHTLLLLGSAPVGPTTVRRLLTHAGRLPVVRFGSTETCLQVMGTPLHLSEDARLAAFEAGWAHPTVGYYIGRPHPPHTECRVVKAIAPHEPGYLEECAEGEPGQLITRGDNLMSGYVDDDAATRGALAGGWYVKLGDIAFWRRAAGGARDFYWCARDSALLIRGGANYSYEQINAELAAFVCAHYALPAAAVEVGVVGLPLASEHEDDCCVTVELKTDEARARQREMEESFVGAAAKAVSKGARPDRVRFAPLPRNFKGAVRLPELKEEWKAALAASSA
ncbi:hypothetical protein AB1Y20_014071 [Prymnesium parvum]|uniref:AMP-dependent synthetase/ligase domain-containing protein n=1 Tax=Prymnesium parvum TaxID=97485 RepID=A0AB34IHT5_PRYPA